MTCVDLHTTVLFCGKHEKPGLHCAEATKAVFFDKKKRRKIGGPKKKMRLRLKHYIPFIRHRGNCSPMTYIYLCQVHSKPCLLSRLRTARTTIEEVTVSGRPMKGKTTCRQSRARHCSVVPGPITGTQDTSPSHPDANDAYTQSSKIGLFHVSGPVSHLSMRTLTLK